uniref:Uncharacterized protein n=1 Tax=Anguilla anguilla TaxID=7936 RepID=A0A0E9RSZ6_ANGAN
MIKKNQCINLPYGPWVIVTNLGRHTIFLVDLLA